VEEDGGLEVVAVAVAVDHLLDRLDLGVESFGRRVGDPGGAKIWATEFPDRNSISIARSPPLTTKRAGVSMRSNPSSHVRSPIAPVSG